MRRDREECLRRAARGGGAGGGRRQWLEWCAPRRTLHAPAVACAPCAPSRHGHAAAPAARRQATQGPPQDLAAVVPTELRVRPARRALPPTHNRHAGLVPRAPAQGRPPPTGECGSPCTWHSIQPALTPDLARRRRRPRPAPPALTDYTCNVISANLSSCQ